MSEIPENSENPQKAVAQPPLVRLLRDGCVYHKKRWSGDNHADLGGTIDEAKTDDLMRQAADLIQSLLLEKIIQKRAALLVMKRNAKRRLGGKHTWSDMDAKAAIKAAKVELRDLRYQSNSLNTKSNSLYRESQ